MRVGCSVTLIDPTLGPIHRRAFWLTDSRDSVLIRADAATVRAWADRIEIAQAQERNAS